MDTKRMINSKWMILGATLLLFLISISACIGQIPNTGEQDNSVATQNEMILQSARATATMMAMQNQISILQTQVAQPTTAPVVPTETPLPTATTVPPTSVPPTAIPAAPTATVIPVPCNSVQFLQDVTVQDGSIFAPGMSFAKTWRLKNNGACTWTTAYALVFSSGSSLGGPAAVALPGNVAPGQVIDLTVNLTAPGKEGNYRGYWVLRDASGVLFGMGRNGNSFYVDIRVAEPQSQYPLDFVASMCQAVWSSGAGQLPCQGEVNDSRGVVRRIDKPQLENGYIDDEPVLFTQPQMITDGVIRGKYPAVRVQAGDHFMAIIGCAYQTEGCDVNFKLDYQIGSGPVLTLATWHERYDEKFQAVDVDLVGLTGNDVKFILTVQANGFTAADRAQWLAPRMVKK